MIPLRLEVAGKPSVIDYFFNGSFVLIDYDHVFMFILNKNAFNRTVIHKMQSEKLIYFKVIYCSF